MESGFTLKNDFRHLKPNDICIFWFRNKHESFIAKMIQGDYDVYKIETLNSFGNYTGEYVSNSGYKYQYKIIDNIIKLLYL